MNNDLENQRLSRIREIQNLNKDEMENLLEVSINENLFFAIKVGGVAGAAFLLNEVTWKDAFEITGRNPVDLIAELLDNQSFFQQLTPGQQYVLQHMNALNNV